MKKFLLTASMLMMGVVATFAQNWEVGQEITNEIGWGNLSFENSPMDFWKVEASGSPTTTGGAFEAYDNDKVDLYQYVKLPAGMYKVVCQGYYRGGSSGSDDPTAALQEGQCAYNWSNRDNWVDNAFLSVYNGVYNEDKGTFIPNHQFKTPLMPRLFEGQTAQIFDEGSEHPDGWNKSDYFYTDLGCYGPTSFPGSCAWFQAGKYMPYEDDDAKYNTVTFFLTEDGYVKVGVVKNAKINQDSFFATNFKMYYMGEAGEAAALLALQDDVEALYEQLVDLRDNGVGFLKGKLEDEIMLYEMAYSADAYSLDKEEATDAKAKLSELLVGATTAKGDLASLQGAISSIEALISTTDYSGKADLTTALEAAKSSISENYVYEGEEDWDTYQVLRDALYAARLDYLKSSPKGEDGSWDFTAFINYHWFCNPEYEPSWDAETNSWVPNQAALDLGWSEKDDVNGTAADIASMVKLGTDQTVIGEWYRVNTGVEVYWNDNLPCVKKWDMPHPEDDVREVAQKIVGIPNGFYKLKALGQTWSNDWDQGEKLCKCRIYAKSGDMVSESPYLEPGGWWGKDINQWKELETDFVEVKNNELIIAGHDNGFIAWTNFRLFYYGETPDFNALLRPMLSNAQEAAAALAWEGDQKIAEDILKKVPANIENNEAFVAAVEIINQANDYINKANAAVNNWKGIENFSQLSTKYDEGSVEASIIATALDATMELGEGENDVYEAAIANNEQYNAYVSYMGYREAIGEFIKDPLVAPVVEEQNAYLTQTFATPEKLDEFKKAIGVPYNQAKFAADGIDKATLDNAKDATFLLINPSFDEGCEKGWTVVGTGAANNNEYSFDDEGNRTNAELWNRPEFTFSQTVNGLPAGTYEFRVRALYRDGGGVDKNMVDAYNAAGGEEEWAKHNAVLFAKSSDNEWDSYIKAIESLKATENSFTQCGTNWETNELDGSKYPIEFHFMNGTLDESEQKEEFKYTGHNEGDYPFDVKVSLGMDEETLVETIYYYPSSMQGFYQACKKDPTAYANSVTFYLSEAGNVELGIRKDAAIGNDWVIMDDFELYYLGKEAPTAIDEVAGAAEAQGAVEYYSVNGVKLNAPQQGINIVKYANGQVKKVFIK
ncbi:MAG: hypothetical protein K6A93_10015 [Bacteroidaceae bacterium]|nr:hypothetical protein [Bacteroidaceae bacterium]